MLIDNPGTIVNPETYTLTAKSLDRPSIAWYNMDVAIHVCNGGMAMAFDKVRYDREYAKANYHIIRVNIPKDKLKTVKAVSESKGKSISSLFVEAFETLYKVNLSRD